MHPVHITWNFYFFNWYQVILGQGDELLLSDSGYVAKHIWWLIPTSPKIWDIGRDTTQPYAVHGYL